MFDMDRLKIRARYKEERDSVSQDQKQPFQVVESSIPDDEERGPEFDKSATAKSVCIASAALGVVLSLLCSIPGIYLLAARPAELGAAISFPDTGREITSLVVNVVLAFCTDGMMFVHSASLRWALYHEGRLEYNTNIRLLTSSRSFGPNRWYINLVALSCLVLTYASSSVLFLTNQAVQPPSPYEEKEYPTSPVIINGTALVGLGIGLAGQAAIAIWCLKSSSKQIPTWSSNPLNTALAAIQKGTLANRSERCMLSVHHKDSPVQESYPLEKQGNMFRGNSTVQYILGLLWSLALLAVAWPITIAAVSKSIGNSSAHGQGYEGACWKFGFHWEQDNGACSRNIVTLSFSPYENTHKSNSAMFSYGAEAVLCLLFVCLIQSIQTIALHCLELLVNLSRDEGIWRGAYSDSKKASGAQLVMNPFIAAISSWENVILFISKALLHWIIGQSLIPSVVVEESQNFNSASIANMTFEDFTTLSLKRGFQFDMVYSRLIIYAVLAILVAMLATFIAARRPSGNQPATLGHLQTIADLVDDWNTDKDSRLWWGDKTKSDTAEVRHAGTCWDRTSLGPIVRTAPYAG